jgi:class 3 adenylate cyclase
VYRADDVPLRPVAGAPPRHRSIIGIDIAGSTERTNVDRGKFRTAMYDLFTEALLLGGILDMYRDKLLDRGDGLVAFVHPVDSLPKPRLINTVVPILNRLLTQHNELHPGQALRVRCVVHAGEVHFDGLNWYGEAVDLACRLLDASELKRKLQQTAADLILITSDDFYRSVVSHGYDGINDQDFEPAARVRLGGVIHRGWINIPEASTIPKQSIGPVIDLDQHRIK